jgi:hypothetical protein
MYNIPLDKAYLIALWLETYLFGGFGRVYQCARRAYTRSFAEIGAYTILFLTALYLLLWRRPSGVSWTLIVPLIILYTLAASVQFHGAPEVAHPVALQNARYHRPYSEHSRLYWAGKQGTWRSHGILSTCVKPA